MAERCPKCGHVDTEESYADALISALESDDPWARRFAHQEIKRILQPSFLTGTKKMTGTVRFVLPKVGG